MFARTANTLRTSAFARYGSSTMIWNQQSQRTLMTFGGQTALSAFRATNKTSSTTMMTTNVAALEPQFGGVLSGGLQAIQRRFKARGNTYQPSTLKRKRKFGFLARLKSRLGRKILARRKEKGRWYLTH